MEGSEGKWAMNRPLSAHITVHYEGEGKEDEIESPESASRVVKTVLSIDAAVPANGESSGMTSRSSVGPLQRYTLQEVQEPQDVDAAGVSPADSRRGSNANSLNVYDFYQCVHRDEESPKTGGRAVARRFSEPRFPNDLHGHHHFQMHRHQHRGSCSSAATATSPILRSMSCAADMDPTIMRLPPLTKPRTANTGDEESLLSPCSSSSSVADSHCLDLSCPCTRHHHRRNSVAVKFNKALYKRT